MDRRSVLVVEDEHAVLTLVSKILHRADFEPVTVTSADDALAALRRRPIDAVISDVCMPARNGIDLVREAAPRYPHVPFLMMTGFASLDSAVECMRAGAVDYLLKPFGRRDLLRALDAAMKRVSAPPSRAPAPSHASSSPELVGSSGAMQEILALVERFANEQRCVLITGESGTGKEKIARALHAWGKRRHGAFLPLNCAAIPAGLIESELFGHTRGAFSGASHKKPGLFDAAHGGTLFLDEIAELVPELQAKLLRVLQDQRIRAVGSVEWTQVDVRVVAATNRDLRAEMEAGRFREDLFYRLSVLPVHVPPLRERPEDIPALADHFLRRHGAGLRRRLTPEAMSLLLRASWRGNVRELENLIERTLVLADGVEEIGPDHLLLDPTSPLRDVAAGERADARPLVARGLTLREVEDELVREALEAAGGSKTEAARMLGISRRTMYRRADRLRDSDRDSGGDAHSG